MPRGKSRENLPLQPLSEAKQGEKVAVKELNVSPSFIYNRLYSLGLHRGSILYVERTKPELLVRVGYTLIAINFQIACKITVCKMPPSSKIK